MNNCIRKIYPNLVVVTMAGTENSLCPVSLTFDKENNLLVVESLSKSNKIRLIIAPTLHGVAHDLTLLVNNSHLSGSNTITIKSYPFYIHIPICFARCPSLIQLLPNIPVFNTITPPNISIIPTINVKETGSRGLFSKIFS